MCEYFLREETSEIVRANFSREYFRKSEYFSEHPIFCEYFWREHFKLFLIKQRVNESFWKVEKARKKKTYEHHHNSSVFSLKRWCVTNFRKKKKSKIEKFSLVFANNKGLMRVFILKKHFEKVFKL